jgi:hypothetical protein
LKPTGAGRCLQTETLRTDDQRRSALHYWSS